MYYYYVFNNLTEAEQALNLINDRTRNARYTEGYTVDDDGYVIGKNAKTGADEPGKQRTIQWSDVITLSDGRCVILTCRVKFPDDYSTIEHNITFDYEDIDIEESSSSSSSSSEESEESSSSVEADTLILEDGDNLITEDEDNIILE